MKTEQVVDRAHLKRQLLSFERNTSPRLSPDARCVAFIRTTDDGQELWLRVGDEDERQVAVHHDELVTDLRWTCDSSRLFYRHTQRGREYWSLSAFRIKTLDHIHLPVLGSVTEYWLSQSDPVTAVFSCRAAKSRYSDLFRVSLAATAGDSIRIAANPGFHRWLVDGDLRPRGGVRLADDGSIRVILGSDLDTARTVLEIGVEEAVDVSIQGFSREGGELFALTSHSANTRHLISIDSETGVIRRLFAHPDLDIESYPIAGDGVWFDPRTGRPDICSVMDQRLRYHALDERHERTIAKLAPTNSRSPVILDRSADDRTWLVVNVRDNAPIEYETLDVREGMTRSLFVNRPELSGYELPKLEDFFFVATDGRPLSGYAMRPLHANGPLPTVMMVHGGPAGRDFWRFYSDAQYLASLGYLSLHINYRGSRGFGVNFRRAGNGEWGGRMQQDLYDAVATGVATGLVDPTRVAFYGASYGGYASLLAACGRPGLVKCAIAISPFCDLISFSKQPPQYWQPLSVLLQRQILSTQDGQLLDAATLESRSPMHQVNASCAAVLLAHGARDPRVPVKEADRFVARAQALRIAVRYLRFDDEGHHVKSNANRAVLFTAIEEFLEEHFGI